MITPQSLADAAALLSTPTATVSIVACPAGQVVKTPSATLVVADVPPTGPAVADFFLRHVAATFAQPGQPTDLVYSLSGESLTIGVGTQAVSPPPPPPPGA